MISLFSHAISALLSKLFDKWTNSYIDRENEENSYRKSVRVSRTLGIVGGIWLILFAAFGVLGIIIWADDMTDWDSFACGILFLFISLLGIFCMLFRRNYRIFTQIHLWKSTVLSGKSRSTTGQNFFRFNKKVLSTH